MTDSDPVLPTLVRYYEMLKGHDWYHYMSDDRRSCWRAELVEQELRSIAKSGGPEYQRLFDGFKRHHVPYGETMGALTGTNRGDNRPPLPAAPIQDEDGSWRLR